jgi:hypothetical protein
MNAAERHLLSLLPTATLQNCRVAQSAEGGGRIVVASRAIAAGEELVRLPAHCALTAASFDALVAGAALPESLSFGGTADDVEMGKLVLVLLRASIERASAKRVGCSHRHIIPRIIVCDACYEVGMILTAYHYSLMIFIQYHRRCT